ncbi:MAG TPA: NifB/NifX family molybdenum-iron cluster-binding protein [Syntrophorhabdaceae bacterium]|nr:NifB/NifX family molybdenum-iron cluster-binding protein [Syntrophorhabdaceae bacterium]HQM81255.1 NifB/NifX family molybdenum-iron cluster-binding protein [Syntrophorhabdaceae bacterium]
MRTKLIIFCMLVLFAVLFFQLAQDLSYASDSEKGGARSSNNIAVAAVGGDAHNEISTVAGRASYYLIFDEKGVFLKSVKNPGEGSGRNSGSAVVNLLLKESCKTVIAGKFGDKLKGQLKANKIDFYERKGIAEKVVRSYTLSS